MIFFCQNLPEVRIFKKYCRSDETKFFCMKYKLIFDSAKSTAHYERAHNFLPFPKTVV